MYKTEFLTLLLCALAALLHGLSGFGFPMISTAALSLFHPLQTAVAMVLIPCIIMNLSVLGTHEKASISLLYYVKNYWSLIGSSLIGSLFGVMLLLYIDESYLKLLLGMVIWLYVLDQFRSQPLHLRRSIKNMLIFGLLAGVIGGATNAMAPFLMMYLLSTQHSKNDIVMITNISFLASKLIQLSILYPTLLTFDQAQIYLLCSITIFSLFFIYLGSKIRIHISQQKFKRLILVILTVLGTNALWQGINMI